jgi:hypothetical protein
MGEIDATIGKSNSTATSESESLRRCDRTRGNADIEHRV